MKKIGLILLAMVFFLSSCGVALPTGEQTGTETESSLDRAKDYTALIRLITESSSLKNYPPSAQFGQRNGLAEAAGAETDSADSKTSGTGDYSLTNIQVEGVDEADIIKTDGSYIYLVANNRLYLIDASEPADMQVVSSIAFNNYEELDTSARGETPLELYLDIENNRLVLLVSGFLNEKVEITYETDDYITREDPDDDAEDIDYGTDEDEQDPGEPGEKETPGTSADEKETPPDAGAGSTGSASSADGGEGKTVSPDTYYSYMPVKQYVKTMVFDIEDRSEPVLVRQFSQEGYYLTSRRIDSAVYIISNQYSYWLMETKEAAADPVDEDDVDPEDVFPSTTDGDVDEEWQTVPADSIAVVPGGDYNSQMVISAIDIANDENNARVLSLIGTSGIVYASAEYLYVAAWQYDWDEDEEYIYEVSTGLYRFRMDGADISEAGTGSVPGAIINQFSMDEHEGYFRIATTTGQMWTRDEENTSKNNVYVLDDNLDIAGQLTGLAPGESIKSVRFMGEMAYVVTFRTVDPLFVIDLAEPENPRVLGELKIPGYSTYLHPVSDSLILGFGYEVEELEEERIVNKGIKVSVFDVSDYSDPREVSTIILGGMGSWADVLYSHKSLLYSSEKNLIAFPANLTRDDDSEYSYEIEFQGLVVLNLDDNNQISERGRITHFAKDKTEYYGYDLIYHSAWINDALYTVSSRQIRASDLLTLEARGSIELPGFDEQNYYYYYGMRDGIAEVAPGIAD